MNGGPSGGIEQKGEWKINARFNKAELSRRCAKVGEFRTRIHVSCTDGIDFIRSLDASSTLYFIDPPYFEKGKTLYLNALDETVLQAGGMGWCYWGAEWVASKGAEATNGSSWENQALWDFDFKALPAVNQFFRPIGQ